VFAQKLRILIMTFSSWFVVDVAPSSIAYVMMHCWQLPQLVMNDELATHDTSVLKAAISALHDAVCHRPLAEVPEDLPCARDVKGRYSRHWGVQYDSGRRGETCRRASSAATSLGIRIIDKQTK